MTDKKNFFVCFILIATLLLTIYYMPSQNSKADGGAQQELTRFQSTIKKFVKSIGDMEQRMQKVEESVQQITKKQEDFHERMRNPQRSNVIRPQAVDVSSRHKQEASVDFFKGEIKRDNYCFDSAEHDVGGTIDIWECHKQGRNQEFQLEEGRIHHKAWCVGVEQAKTGELVFLKNCNDEASILEWQYRNGTFRAAESTFCMANSAGSGPVALAQCNAGEKSQQWHLERAYNT